MGSAEFHREREGYRRKRRTFDSQLVAHASANNKQSAKSSQSCGALMTTVIAMLFAALLTGVNLPATAHAECGEPGQDPCTGPVPTVDQVVADMAELTDPNIPAINKGNVVTPGFTPEEATTIDDHLHRTDAAGLLPYNFVVTDIVPAPANFAGVTVTITGSFHQESAPQHIVLSDQGGHWLITHDAAWTMLDHFWYNAHTRMPPFVRGNVL